MFHPELLRLPNNTSMCQSRELLPCQAATATSRNSVPRPAENHPRLRCIIEKRQKSQWRAEERKRKCLGQLEGWALLTASETREAKKLVEELSHQAPLGHPTMLPRVYTCVSMLRRGQVLLVVSACLPGHEALDASK